jgi:hypothetical protein
MKSMHDYIVVTYKIWFSKDELEGFILEIQKYL